MLSTIEFIKNDGGVLTLPIYDPTSFQIRDIQGLDPVKANIVTSNFSQMDGAQYQTSRREMRNLVFKLGIISSNGGKNVQELRSELYSYLLPKTDIKIHFIQDSGQTLVINGHVESFDSPLFVKEPEAQISILCFDPDFYSEDPVVVSSASTLTNSPSIINYDGNVDSGFVFSMSPTQGVVETLTIENTLSDGSIRSMLFNLTSPLVYQYATLNVGTIPGNKYVTFNKNGIDTAVLWTLDPNSDWLKLYPGTNNIKVTTNINFAVPYTITYNTRYGGL